MLGIEAAVGRTFGPEAEVSGRHRVAVLSDGTKFDGMPGLRKMLLDRSGEFVAATTEKLLMYAIGRNLQYYDAPTVREIVRQAAPAKYTFSSILLGVVKSAPFQMRKTTS